MTIENFLSFWSHHNTAIIEGLVALIIISSLYLAFRSLFAKRGGDGDFAGAQVEVDTSKIEKTLQKILDNQAKSAKAAQAVKPAKVKASAAEDMGMDINLDDLESSAAVEEFEQMENQAASPLMEASSAAVAESPAEIAQLKLTLAESQAKIEELLAQLAGQSSANAAPGMSAQEKEAFQNQIQDLEARLAEYEIISEDIADLSKYREENEQLKFELSQALAKSGAGAAAAPTPVPVEEPAPSLPAEEPPAYNEGAPASEDNSAELIDEELMREFAAAVEGQKAASAAAKEAPAAPAPVDTSAADDAEKLMSEFENFVSKKS